MSGPQHSSKQDADMVVTGYQPSRRSVLKSSFAGAALWSIGSTSQASAAGPKTIRIAMSAGLDRLDPVRTANGPDLAVISEIYETLLRLDPKTGQLLPNLAVSYEVKEPTLWQFDLRRDVLFHDGSKLTAADVKYSIELIIDPANHSPHFSQLASVEKIDTPDDYTVQIRTKTPDPLLGRRMQPIGGTGRVFIVSKAYGTSHSPQEVNDQPMGTGPYRLTAWRKGQSVTLTRNTSYWGRMPDVEEGIFTFIPENGTRVNALLRGEVDVIQRVPIPDVARIEKSPDAQVVSDPHGLVHTMLLNMLQPPFDDIDVRKAFAHALDMKTIIGSLLGKYGRVLGVPMGPTVVQYDASIVPYAYDPEQSRKLLAGRAPIELKTYTSDGRYVDDREIYQAVNAQLDAVGFKIAPQQMEWGRLIAMMSNRTAGPFYIIGWDFGEDDASKMNSFLLSTSPISITRDADYDRLALAGNAEMNPAARTNIWKQAQQVIHDHYLVGAVWEAAAIYGVSRKLEYTPLFGENLDLASIKIRAE
jgi:peptide/nickel transport system substrate-binding protein